MDIHRARCVPYPPSAINALAFSHFESDASGNDPECLRLAVGRANGNIEIWNPYDGAWLQERVFYGGKDRSVEGLEWTQEPDRKDENGKKVPGKLRLFSIGYSSSITEWDTATGLPARHSNGNHSEVWCFAAQPKLESKKSKSIEQDEEKQQKLVAGCADGTIVLLSTEDNDLRFERFVTRSVTKKARALSITYKDRNLVIAGFADSMMRVYDTRNGTVIRNISLGTAPHGGPKEILVWKVKCLANGDFVSGNSTGEVRFYDGKNYSQTQRILGHEADVLDLAVSRDGKKVFSGGMDRRTCFYTSKTSGEARASQGGKWRKVSHQRYHEHDIKAMTSYEGKKLNMVVSGGIDTKLVVFPLRHFGQELSRGLSTLPSDAPLKSAADARLMVSWWNSELRIWRVKPQENGIEKPKVVARLALQGEENIASVSITSDGELLAVATASEVKLFQLTQPNKAVGVGLRIKKMDLPTTSGARLLKFTTDGKWLVLISASNEVQLVRMIRTNEPLDRPRALPKMMHLRRLYRDEGTRGSSHRVLGQYNRAIVHADFSTDGRVLAVADLAGYIDTWIIEGHEDPTAPEVDVDMSSDTGQDDGSESEDEDEAEKEQVIFLGQRWIQNPFGHMLPRLDSTPVTLSFRPSSNQSDRPEPNGNPAVHPTRRNAHPHSHDIPHTEYRLLLTSVENQLYYFDVLSGRLSEWSRRNPPSSYPSPFRLLDLPAKGCIWDISGDHDRVWLYSEKWLFMFDLSTDLPIPDSSQAASAPTGTESKGMAASKKRKRELEKNTSRKTNSGAGDLVPQDEVSVTKLRKFESGGGKGKAAWIDIHGPRALTEIEEDDEDKHKALASIRRTAGHDGVAHPDDGPTSESNNEQSVVRRNQNDKAWWHTFKYRPILGMVPLNGDGHSVEVVLVERPLWDLDLPPRFVGSHEN